MRGIWRTARYEFEDVTVTDEDCEFPVDAPLPDDLQQSEASQFIANGTLTPDAWQAHLAGRSWLIQVGGVR